MTLTSISDPRLANLGGRSLNPPTVWAPSCTLPQASFPCRQYLAVLCGTNTTTEERWPVQTLLKPIICGLERL